MSRPGHGRARAPLSRARAALLSPVVVLLLAACGADDNPDDADNPDGEASTSAAAEASPYPTVPDGVELTDPGTGLSVGEQAVLAWEPRENKVGVLEAEVSRIELTTWDVFSGWKLDAATKAMSPYFVHARFTNAGDTDLGDTTVPLYGLDTTGVLIEASKFADRFGPCPGNGVFPKKFAPDASASVCLVYMVEEGRRMRGVSFRPIQEFDQITWTGAIDEPGAEGKQSKKSNQEQGG